MRKVSKEEYKEMVDRARESETAEEELAEGGEDADQTVPRGRRAADRISTNMTGPA